MMWARKFQQTKSGIDASVAPAILLLSLSLVLVLLSTPVSSFSSHGVGRSGYTTVAVATTSHPPPRPTSVEFRPTLSSTQLFSSSGMYYAAVATPTATVFHNRVYCWTSLSPRLIFLRLLFVAFFFSLCQRIFGMMTAPPRPQTTEDEDDRLVKQLRKEKKAAAKKGQQPEPRTANTEAATRMQAVNDLKTMVEDLAAKEATIASMQKDATRYAATIASLQEEKLQDVTAIQTRYEQNQSQIDRLEQDIVDKEQQIAAATEKAQRMEQEKKEEQVQAKKEGEGRMRRTAERLKILIDDVASKETTIAAMTEESKMYDSKLASLTEDTKQELQTIQTKYESTQSKMGTLEEQIVEKEQNIADATVTIDELRKQSKITTEQFQKESKTYQSQVVELKQQVADRDTDLVEKTTVLETLEKASTTKDSTIGALQSDLVSIETQKKELEEHVRDMAEKELTLENDLELAQNEATKERKQTQEQFDAYETTVWQLQAELKQTQDELAVFVAGVEAERAKKAAAIAIVTRRREQNQRGLLINRLQREAQINEAIAKRADIIAMLNEARLQPKSVAMEQQLSEKYNSIEDIEQRAYAICVDLKMIESYDL